MKIVEINSGFRGSTGTIMLNIAKIAREQDYEAYTFSRASKEAIPMGHNIFGGVPENLVHRLISVFSGISGIGSNIGTRRLLARIDEIKPDIIHLHNLHGWYINLPMLFGYIKRNNIKTVWTLHDCWAFTAQCSHFTLEKCDKWKTGCYSCPRYRIYPYTFVDRTKTMWKLKKQWFTGVKDLTIVTPSEWLAGLVKQSYLKEYPVKVINNGIDLSLFKPTEGNFRERLNLGDKYVILGVASPWGPRKGLDVFVELSHSLSDDFQIVLVGTDEKVDKWLPENIISIHRTTNQKELAEIYSASDVFVNPTREEVFGLVNVEALACATPVITFKTGGSPETIDEVCGSIVLCDDIAAMEKEIVHTCIDKPYSKEACLRRAKEFDARDKFKEYTKLYKTIMEGEDYNKI